MYRAAVILIFSICFLPGSSPASELDFVRDVNPVLTKSGCNTGECHGAATGQGGFRLSLLGYDSPTDYESLTRELGARRVDLQDPEKSLILRKPTQDLKHKGGRIFNKRSPEYQKLLEWIESGAPYGRPDLEITALQVSPKQSMVSSSDAKIQLKATATFSDGNQVDVTRWALFDLQDDSMGEVDESGALRLNRPGVSSVMVRYSGKVAAVRAIYPISPPVLSKSETALEASNPPGSLDQALLEQFQLLQLIPASNCAPEKFLRRACLTIAGRLPSEEETRDWLASPDSTERRRTKIASLLNEPGYVDLWTNRLADMLRISAKNHGEASYAHYHRWLRNQIAANRPWNETVAAMLTASGSLNEASPTSFYRLTRDPRDMGEFVSQTLMGTRLACARCHHHPFDQWSMADYYSFASWFSQTAWEGNSIELKLQGEVTHPKTGKEMEPRFPGISEALTIHETDRRVSLAEWMTERAPERMAQTMVNRVWSWMLGEGLVTPVDDLRPSNPAAHPEILNLLTQEFIDSGFDLKNLIATIANSQVFQFSSEKSGPDYSGQAYFSRFTPIALKGATLADALSDATGSPWSFLDDSTTVRVTQLSGPSEDNYTLEVLGVCSREVACDDPSELGGGLSMALRLLNGEDLNRMIRNGWLESALSDELTNVELIEMIYLRTLSRFPSEMESKFWKEEAERTGDRKLFFTDLLWATLNSREFLFIH